MRTYLKILSAAVVAVGTIGYTFAEDKVVEKTVERTLSKNASEKMAIDQPALKLPQGIQEKDLKEQADIRNAFESVTESAASNDIFDQIADRLVDADRDRVNKFKDSKPDWKPIRDRVAKLNADWMNKYGKKFDLDKEAVFGANGYVAILQGEVADPTALVGHWPLAPQQASAAQTASGNQPAAAPVDTAKQANDAGKLAGGRTNLEKGRNVAVARYPAGHGISSVDVSLIHQAPDTWKLDIPDNVEGKTLHDNLVHHLDMLGDPAKWPTDVNEGYRVVAHHVLLALYNVSPEQSKAQ